jgi:hypothetical protein
MTGTANKGKPTPNVPLIKPPHMMAVQHTAMTSSVSVLNGIDIWCDF